LFRSGAIVYSRGSGLRSYIGRLAFSGRSAGKRCVRPIWWQIGESARRVSTSHKWCFEGLNSSTGRSLGLFWSGTIGYRRSSGPSGNIGKSSWIINS
jgi:hypothetical protein